MAKVREKSLVRLLGVTGRKRSDLLIGTALQATTLLVLAFPAAAQPARNARPMGGSVVAGSAAISQSPNTTTINQASQQAAINWQSFNVGAKQTVTFEQPSSSAIALNRVIGPDPSQIAGRIDANGQIVLTNQAGVTFYKGAQVNAQSLIVTTSNISNANFMAGHMVFDQAGNPNAGVVNQGTITVKQAGLAALVAPRVANSGVIHARMGHVVLAGAKTATLDLYGDGLLALDVSNQVTQAPVGPDGTQVTALVTNTGVISAKGGTVQLTAAAADGVLQNLVDAGGKITANTAGTQTGTVTIAGIGGSVNVTGLVSAAGHAAGTTGGQVAVNATGDVTLGAKARVNASGKNGGGAVAIGTTLARAIGGPGTVATMTAANVAVRKGARISANATKSGNGGRVTVLSTNTTRMAGTISATGGALTGDGGFVEVSGENLGLTGMVHIGAPHGQPGTLLLDPTDLDIIASTTTTGNSVDGDFQSGTLSVGDGSPMPSTVSASTIQSVATEGDIVLKATGSIDVQTSVFVFNNFTLQAGGNLTIESGVSLQSGGNLLLQAGMVTQSGALTINGIVQSLSGSGVTQLISGTGGIAFNGNLTTATLDLITTGGGVTEAPGAGMIVNGGLTSSQGVVGNVSLLGGGNHIATIQNFTVTGGNFQMANVDSYAITGNLSAPNGNVYLQDADQEGIEILIGAGVTTAPTGTASFQVDGLLLAGQGPSHANVVSGTFELAPNSIGLTETLGAQNISFGLALPSLVGITATQLRFGAVTLPNTVTPTVTAGTIAIAGTFDSLNRSLELDASTSVDGTAAPLINVATLSGGGGADWLLLPPTNDNSIANIGNVAAGEFRMTDSVGVTVSGTVTSTGAELEIADVGNLIVSGAISGQNLSLSGDNIDIPGVVNAGASGNVSLIANVGTIGETGILITQGLVGSAIGAVDLFGASATANQVAIVGRADKLIPPGFTAGSFALRDGINMTVIGTVSATDVNGQAFLAGPGVTVGATGAVTADASTGTVSLETDLLVNAGTVIANTLQLAPNTAGGTVTMGAAGSGLSLTSFTGFSANNLLVGAVTPPAGGAPTTTAGGIVIGGAFAFPLTGGLTLDAASSSAPGATGAVTQTAPLTGVTTLSGTANSYTLTNTGNAIDTLANLTATTGDLEVVSSVQLFANGVAALTGNVYLESSAPAGVSLSGPVIAQGRVGVSADFFSLQSTGDVVANTFELAPFTPGVDISLGTSSTSGLFLQSLTGITAATARIGAITLPGGTSPTILAGAVTVAGPFSGTGVDTLELDAVGAISQSAPLTNVATLAATGASVVLTDTGNLIDTSSGMTATAGNVVIVDGKNLILNGAYSGDDLFFEVALAGGNLTIGGTGQATLSPAAGATISLVADGLSANTTGSIGNAGGTVQLAPFSAANVSLSGTGGTGTTFTAALLSSIDVGVGTLLIGGFTNLPAGSSTLTTTAGAISLDGAVDLGGRAGTLVLLANGAVTEPGGPLTVSTVTGTSKGDFSLSNTANQFQASTGITATNGDIVLVDGSTLQLTGPYTGNDLLFQVRQPGGSLVLGAASTPATLAVPDLGRVSLVADSITATAASTITVPFGTLEVAPFSAINESVLGTSATGQLLVDTTLLADVKGQMLSLLVIGGYTPVQPGGGLSPVTGTVTPSASAGSVTLDGTLNLATLAVDLELLATGRVSQPGGPLTVDNVSGASGGNFSLTNTANAIGQSIGITSSNGDVVLVDGIDLGLAGPHAGNNLFFEVAAQGGSLNLGITVESFTTPAQLTVANGGRISLVADSLSEISNSTVTAPAGRLELAPFSAVNVSVFGGPTAGPFLVDQTMLSIVTPGLATLAIGGFTNEPAGATTVRRSASSLSIDGTVTLAPFADGLDLEAIGAVTQIAPLVNVGTLTAIGGSVVLANQGNRIDTSSGMTATAGNVVLVDAANLALNGAYSGDDLFFEVALPGGNLTIGVSGPATLNAGAGARISLVADGLRANTTGSIGNAGGTVELAPFSSIDVSLAGTGGGMAISTSLLSNIDVGGGTLLIGGFTNLAAGSSTLTTTAGAITLNGAVDLSGRAGTLVLLANGAVTEPGGPLTVGTVTGVSTGDFSLSNTGNQFQASTGVTAHNGDVVLVDDPTMQLTGTYTGNNLFFQVTQPGGSLALGDADTPATLITSTGGRISLVADSITATTDSTITTPFGTLEVAPFSAINESVLGTGATGQLLVDGTLLADVTGGMLNTLVIGGYTPVQSDGRLSQIASGAAPTVSASGVTLDGVLNLTALATNLELLSIGAVTEPGGPLTVANVFGASGGDFSLTNTANAIGQSLGITSSNGDVVLVDGADLALIGAHTGNNLFFEVAAQGGTLSVGTATEAPSDPAAQLTAANGGRISLVADHLTESADSTVTAPAGTLELAPLSPVNVSVFGGPTAGPFLVDSTMLSIVTPGLATLVVGGFTNEPAGATTAAPSASSLSVDGTVTLAPFASGIDLLATGVVTQVAPLVNVGTLAATGGSVVLANAGNLIASSSGITATAGNIVLVDGESLALNGTYSGNDLFFEVAAKGGELTIGGTIPATLNAASGARISLVADGLSANTTGSIGNAGGTVELAPFSPIDVSLASGGGSGMVISTSLLSNINVGGGTLLIGGFTNLPAGSSTLVTTAGAITLDGAVDLSGRAGTLVLLASGSVTEPGGPLTVGTVTGVSTGDFSLSNTANQIQASTGITANNGSVILVDDPTLQLTGTYSGTNLFFQVTQPGGSLALGDAAAPAVLLADGKISLVADGMTATATSTITNPSGTLEIAPFSAINESVAGNNGTGQLLVDGTLLADISSALNLLVIGGYTPLVNGTVRTTGGSTTVSASGVTIDGPLDLTTRATELELLANGPVTEPGGPLTVNTVFGSSVGAFSLTNPANAIARTVGITATGGDVAVVDGVSLNATGQYTGNNLFFEVAAQGGTLTLGGTSGVITSNALAVPAVLTAASGDRITLVADRMMENGGGSLTAAGGTVEFAPFSAINTSLLGSATSGQLLIDPTLLSSITPGISTLRVGGFTNEPAAATAATPSAGGISIDGTVNLASVAMTLDLQAIGAVTQIAPILNVGTLIGTTGSTSLTNSANSVGVIGNYLASNGFALTDATNLRIAGVVSAGPSANFTVNGALTEPGGITANRLSGSAVGTASLTGTNNVAELDGFVVGGTSGELTFIPTGNLLIDGTVNATRIVVSAPSSQLTLGDGASIVTGGSTRPTSTIAPASLLPANGGPGAYFQAASFNQAGTSRVSGQAGGPSTLQISVSGNVQFDSHSGLSANGTWLILTLTTGTATGDVFVKALDVSYTPLATGSTTTSLGGADLFGTVNGVSGVAAAGLAFIQPALNTHYLFNNCEIGSAACLVNTTLPILARIQTETAIFVPATSLLSLLSPALVLDPEDSDNLLEMPVVSREDY